MLSETRSRSWKRRINDLFEYLLEQDFKVLVKFANSYRKELYGDDWTPDLTVTTEKFDKLFEILFDKIFTAGHFGPGNKN